MDKQIYSVPILITPMTYHPILDDKYEMDAVFYSITNPEIFEVNELVKSADAYDELIKSLENKYISYFISPLRASGFRTRKLDALEHDMFDVYLMCDITVFKNALNNNNLVTNSSLLYFAPKYDEEKDKEEIFDKIREIIDMIHFGLEPNCIIPIYLTMVKETFIDKIDWKFELMTPPIA